MHFWIDSILQLNIHAFIDNIEHFSTVVFEIEKKSGNPFTSILICIWKYLHSRGSNWTLKWFYTKHSYLESGNYLLLSYHHACTHKSPLSPRLNRHRMFMRILFISYMQKNDMKCFALTFCSIQNLVKISWKKKLRQLLNK